MVLDVREQGSQIRIVLSRTHPDFIRRLFDLEVPEVAEKIIEICALAREAGYDCAVIKCDGGMIIPLEPNPKDSVQRSGLDRIRSTGLLYFAYKEGMVILQREQWLIDRYRRKMVRGETKEYKEAVELDIDYMFKGRTIVDSLAL